MILNQINIGSLAIKTPVLLCPLAGITDVPYRAMVRSFGANLMYSEMISSMAITRNSTKTLKMAEISQEVPTGIQLAGSNLEILSEAAKIAEDLGAVLIDINMGCPAKKVVNGIAGSAVMKDECLAGKIMETLVNSVKIPVTVKMRLGWDSANINAPTLAKIAEESGVSLVTVHGRTRQQFYSGESNWETVGSVVKNVSIPVIVNGDIIDVQSAKKALSVSGASGIMVGRGTYGRPWLIKELSDNLSGLDTKFNLSNEEKLEVALMHYNLMIDYYGDVHGMKIARKHLSWYTKGLRNSAHLRATINVSEDINEVKDLIAECFYNDSSNKIEHIAEETNEYTNHNIKFSRPN
jgi:tRNA-dihydrouridine synthase B